MFPLESTKGGLATCDLSSGTSICFPVNVVSLWRWDNGATEAIRI